jgi:cytoskeletal protein CcmA (bactofilin family)
VWKKTDAETPSSHHLAVSMPEQNPVSRKREPATPPRGREPATIGPSIWIRGDLSGEEDIIVQGRVEGTISLQQNNVTVGKEGRIKANIRARSVTVDGQVDGNLFGEEQVVVRRSARVQGDITTNRVALEDGCKFKGAIDMSGKRADQEPGTPAHVSELKMPNPAGSVGPGKVEPTPKRDPSPSP